MPSELACLRLSPFVVAWLSARGAFIMWRVWLACRCAPEVLLGQPATEKADIYSFGIVLFEIITGEPPRRRAQLPQGQGAGGPMCLACLPACLAEPSAWAPPVVCRGLRPAAESTHQHSPVLAAAGARSGRWWRPRTLLKR